LGPDWISGAFHLEGIDACLEPEFKPWKQRSTKKTTKNLAPAPDQV